MSSSAEKENYNVKICAPSPYKTVTGSRQQVSVTWWADPGCLIQGHCLGEAKPTARWQKEIWSKAAFASIRSRLGEEFGANRCAARSCLAEIYENLSSNWAIWGLKIWGKYGIFARPTSWRYSTRSVILLITGIRCHSLLLLLDRLITRVIHLSAVVRWCGWHLVIYDVVHHHWVWVRVHSQCK